MFNKGIFAIALIAFVGVQLGSTLQCYTCTSADNCKEPKLANCSNAVAAATSLNLVHYNNEVDNRSHTDSFQCLQAEYVSMESANDKAEGISLFGCVYREISACNLALKPTYKLRNCRTCIENKCNPSNTADITNLAGEIESNSMETTVEPPPTPPPPPTTTTSSTTTRGTTTTTTTTVEPTPPPPTHPATTTSSTTNTTTRGTTTTGTISSTPSTTTTTEASGTAGTYSESKFIIIASMGGMLLTNIFAQLLFI